MALLQCASRGKGIKQPCHTFHSPSSWPMYPSCSWKLTAESFTGICPWLQETVSLKVMTHPTGQPTASDCLMWNRKPRPLTQFQTILKDPLDLLRPQLQPHLHSISSPVSEAAKPFVYREPNRIFLSSPLAHKHLTSRTVLNIFSPC